MPTATNLQNSRLSSHTASRFCGSDLARNAFVRRPNDGLSIEGCVSSLRLPLLVGERAARNSCFQWPFGLVRRRNLHQRTDSQRVGSALEAFLSRSGPTLVPRASRRGRWHRWRLWTAGFHARRRVHCVCSHFFPRSVGLGPTASCARGALTIPPSRLCHRHAIPCRSSYSASPFRHRRTNTPFCTQSRKYLWMELALPKRSSGKAFHWQPVRNTYTIPSNTRRGSRGGRPPPGFRRYLRFPSRFGLGTTGSTAAHSSSDTVHDRIALMPRNCRRKPTEMQLLVYG